MKKHIIILLLILFLTGCKNKEIITTCIYKSNQELNGYNMQSNYKIYSKNNIVKKVIINQEIESKDINILKRMEKNIDEQYSLNNVRYGGYRFNTKYNKNKLISDITINYDLLNMDKFIMNNEAMKEFVNKNNKLSLDGAKRLYESIGAKCK